MSRIARRASRPHPKIRRASLAPLLPVIAAFLAASPSWAEDWPQWRGPDRNGLSRETAWRKTWPGSGPVELWKARVGAGFSSFAVAGNRAYTLGNSDNTDTVTCLDMTNGRTVWTHSYPSDLGAKYFEGGTTGTPTLDGSRLYTLGRWGDLFCFEAASGKILWSKNIQKETGARIPSWGFSGSPTVFDNLLLLNVGEAGVGLDKTTGEILWKSGDDEAGYSTPLPYRRNGEWFALMGSGKSYLAVQLPGGQEAWRVRWLTQYGVNAADPIPHNDHIFIASGYGKGALLFQLDGPNPDPKPVNVWQSKVLRTQMNPGVLLDGHLYAVDGDDSPRATLKCVEYLTGREVWSEPGFGSGGLMAADGHLIALGDRGELMVAPATPKGFSPTARHQVFGGKSWTAPVLANGTILCRNSRGDVVCLDVKL